jgi:hypothetical protein
MTQPPAVARAMAVARSIPPEDLPRLRSRMRWVLFTVAALGSTGYIAAVTVGTLACRRRRPRSARPSPPA